MPVKIGIMMSLRKDPDFAGTRAVVRRLLDCGAEVLLEEKAAPLAEEFSLSVLAESALEQRADALLAVGGDGTFLRAAHTAMARSTPVLGVNFGRVGYLTELEVSELALLDRLVAGDYRIERRMMLRADVLCRGEVRFCAVGLNEAALQNGRISRILDFDVSADGGTVGRYRADGVIISTPTGSTAYALAAGGPIIDPAVSGLLMVPICPHALSARAVFFSDRAEISIRLPFLQGREAFLSVDGRDTVRLTEEDEVRVVRALEETRMVRLKGWGFNEILHSKLSV